jgi:hypothetical protein
LFELFKKSRTKKFKINEIQNKYKKEEKQKTPKKMAPKGFEPGSCGARGGTRFHWAN